MISIIITICVRLMIAEFFVGIFTRVSLSREKKPKNSLSVSWITAKILYLKSFLYTDVIK